MLNSFDAQAKPPNGIKETYKIFQKLSKKALDTHLEIVDLKDHDDTDISRITRLGLHELPCESRNDTDDRFYYVRHETKRGSWNSTPRKRPPIVEVKSIPGKFHDTCHDKYPSEKGRSVHLSISTTTRTPA